MNNNTFPALQVLNNKNLFILIINYLHIKDLLRLTQVNKHCNILISLYQPKWRYECISFFSSVPKSRNFFETNNSWKKIFKENLLISLKWNKNSNNDIIKMKNSIYHNLHSFSPFPRLHKQSSYIENDTNTSFQLYLYDMLYEEQALYTELDEAFQNSKNLKIALNNILKSDFDTYVFDINKYIKAFKNRNKKDQISQILLKLRWYIFDEGMFNKVNGMILFIQFPPLFIVQLLAQTMISYCKMIAFYLMEISSPVDLINEYMMRYKKYVDVIIDINDKYQNLSIMINYVYDAMEFTVNNIPKFSLIRMCMKIWNINVLRVIKTKLTESIKKYIDIIIDRDFKEVIPPSCECNNIDMLNKARSNSTINHSLSTACSSISTLNGTINFVMEIEQRNSIQNEDLIDILSMLNDTLCDEYSVYRINLSNFDNTNDIISKIENDYCEIIRSKLENIFYIYEKQICDVCHRLFSIINSGDHYIMKFLPRLQIKVLSVIFETIKTYIKNQLMYKNFVMFWEINKQYINTLPESGTISIENIPDFEEAFIYSFLLDKCNNRAMVNIFIAQYYKESNSIFYLISDTKKWFLDKEGKIQMFNRKVEKELKRQNLFNLDLSPYQKKFLSFFALTTMEDLASFENEMKE